MADGARARAVFDLDDRLSRRSRQILDVLFREEEGSVPQISDEIPGARVESIRVTLRNLEREGLVTHRRVHGIRIYRAAVPRELALRSAIERLVRVFCAGVPEEAVRCIRRVTSTPASAEVRAWRRRLAIAPARAGKARGS